MRRYLPLQEKSAANEQLLEDRERQAAAVDSTRAEAQAAAAEREDLRKQLQRAAEQAARHALPPERVRTAVCHFSSSCPAGETGVSAAAIAATGARSGALYHPLGDCDFLSDPLQEQDFSQVTDNFNTLRRSGYVSCCCSAGHPTGPLKAGPTHSEVVQA